MSLSGLFWSCFEVLFLPPLPPGGQHRKQKRGLGGTMWGNLLKCPHNPKGTDVLISCLGGQSSQKCISGQIYVIVSHAQSFIVVWFFLLCVTFCIHMALGESFIILRSISLCFIHASFTFCTYNFKDDCNYFIALSQWGKFIHVAVQSNLNFKEKTCVFERNRFVFVKINCCCTRDTRYKELNRQIIIPILQNT